MENLYSRGGHCPKALKREHSVRKKLVLYLCPVSCIILDECIREAMKAASVASGRCWSTGECLLFAKREKFISRETYNKFHPHN